MDSKLAKIVQNFILNKNMFKYSVLFKHMQIRFPKTNKTAQNNTKYDFCFIGLFLRRFLAFIPHLSQLGPKLTKRIVEMWIFGFFKKSSISTHFYG